MITAANAAIRVETERSHRGAGRTVIVPQLEIMLLVAGMEMLGRLALHTAEAGEAQVHRQQADMVLNAHLKAHGRLVAHLLAHGTARWITQCTRSRLMAHGLVTHPDHGFLMEETGSKTMVEGTIGATAGSQNVRDAGQGPDRDQGLGRGQGRDQGPRRGPDRRRLYAKLLGLTARQRWTEDGSEVAAGMTEKGTDSTTTGRGGETDKMQ